MVTRMVSWHWALYRAFFRVPWRALVPVPPSHAPQLSNLYLQSAGGRVPGSELGGLWPPPRVCSGPREAGPPAYPPPAPHLTSKLLLPVTGDPAPDALRLGPAGALAETHAAVLAARGAGPPDPLRALAPRASLLHFVYNAWGTELRTQARRDSLGDPFLESRPRNRGCRPHLPGSSPP